MIRTKPLLLAALMSLTPAAAHARDYARQAQKAAEDDRTAITIFVDVDWGGREDGAARELTRAHSAFAARAYLIVDVEAFTENGDLQGFFVTYRRERAAPAAH
jgi:hypothetical protein